MKKDTNPRLNTGLILRWKNKDDVKAQEGGLQEIVICRIQKSSQLSQCSFGLNMTTRILIIEDDPTREEKLRSWLPADMNAVNARSAGTAIGILKRDKGKVYAGIVLDHDLERRPASESDLFLCGKDVVDIIISKVFRDVSILIHSVNESQVPVMHTLLEKAGFAVKRIPMDVLTAASFNEWLDYVRENFES